MRTRIFAAIAAAMTVSSAPAIAADPPYLKLAQAFGTPNLANSTGPKDKSQLLLHFVRRGETYAHWTKMTTVSILHVGAGDSDGATRGVITRMRASLKKSGAHVHAFDENPVAPVSGYFEFYTKIEQDAGIVYSPAPGYVTVAQLGARNGAKIAAADRATFKHIIGR